MIGPVGVALGLGALVSYLIMSNLARRNTSGQIEKKLVQTAKSVKMSMIFFKNNNTGDIDFAVMAVSQEVFETRITGLAQEIAARQ